MERFVPAWLLRVPQRNLGMAALFAVVGCVWVVFGTSAFVFSTQGIVTKTGNFILALTQFVLAGFYALPDSRLRVKQWLRVALLLTLALLSMSVLIFIAARQGQSI